MVASAAGTVRRSPGRRVSPPPGGRRRSGRRSRQFVLADVRVSADRTQSGCAASRRRRPSASACIAPSRYGTAAESITAATLARAWTMADARSRSRRWRRLSAARASRAATSLSRVMVSIASALIPVFLCQLLDASGLWRAAPGWQCRCGAAGQGRRCRDGHACWLGRPRCPPATAAAVGDVWAPRSTSPAISYGSVIGQHSRLIATIGVPAAYVGQGVGGGDPPHSWVVDDGREEVGGAITARPPAIRTAARACRRQADGSARVADGRVDGISGQARAHRAGSCTRTRRRGRTR